MDINWRNPESAFGTGNPSPHYLFLFSIVLFASRLVLASSGRHITASVVHHENGEVLSASTKEWALKEQLYRTNDTSAYINLGRVLAQRCLESGLIEIQNFIEPTIKDGKVASFLKAVEDGGVCLQEPEQYKNPAPCEKYRPEKPWEVTE